VPGVATKDENEEERLAARASSASSRGSLFVFDFVFVFLAAAVGVVSASVFSVAVASAFSLFACSSSRETSSAFFLPLVSSPLPSAAARSCATVIFEGGKAESSSGAQRELNSFAGVAPSTRFLRAAGSCAATPLRSGWQLGHAYAVRELMSNDTTRSPHVAQRSRL
jgi:hypothetical protein